MRRNRFGLLNYLNYIRVPVSGSRSIVSPKPEPSYNNGMSKHKYKVQLVDGRFELLNKATGEVIKLTRRQAYKLYNDEETFWTDAAINERASVILRRRKGTRL